MANCPNCGAPLEDGARFCSSCGAPVAPEEAQAGASEAPVPESETPEAPAPETPVSEVPVSVPASETVFCPNCGEPAGAASEYCDHCGAALGMGGAQAEKKSGGSGLKKWLICGGAAAVAAAIVIVLISVFSGGGKGYGLYIKDKELYYSDLSKNGAWQVSSRLYEDGDNLTFAYGGYYIYERIVMSRDGKTLFFPDRLSELGHGDFTLYYRGASGKKDASKVDSGVTRYTVNDSASLVTYLKNGNLYQYALSRDEKEKLAGDVYTFHVSDDGKKIIFLDEDDALYQLDSGKEKQKLDSDVSIETVSDDCKTVIYTKDDTLYLKQDGKEKVKIASGVSRPIFAYGTGEAYYIKEDGRESTLYYFDGRESTALTDEYDDWSGRGYETPGMVYRDAGGDYWLASGGKTTELDAEEPYGFVFSADGKSLWYVDEPDKNYEGELYQVAISNGTAKKAEKQDVDVYVNYISCTPGGHLLYFKDVSDDSEGELYVDGKKADDDVYLYSVQESESGALLYLTDYNDRKSYGTLKQYSGGKSAKVADDVSQAYFMPNGSILYLSDYSTSRYRGDLYAYSGNKSTLLDDDVITIIPITDGKYRGLY